MISFSARDDMMKQIVEGVDVDGGSLSGGRVAEGKETFASVWNNERQISELF
jgi:hypothetical protein